MTTKEEGHGNVICDYVMKLLSKYLANAANTIEEQPNADVESLHVELDTAVAPTTPPQGSNNNL